MPAPSYPVSSTSQRTIPLVIPPSPQARPYSYRGHPLQSSAIRGAGPRPQPQRARRATRSQVRRIQKPRPRTAPRLEPPGGRSPSRSRYLAARVPAWTLVLALLAGGAGLALDPNPLSDSPPAPWELGVLIPEGPSLFRLALCTGDELTQPMASANISLSQPVSLDPAVGEIDLLNSSSILHVEAHLPGQTLLSFQAAPVGPNGTLGQNQTVRIYLRVGLCAQPGQELDPELLAALNNSAAATPPNGGQLLDLGENAYLLVACQGSRYSFLFDQPAQVRNSASADPGVAALVLYNPPARLMVYATNTGTTSLSFEADALEFPLNQEEWLTFTLQVTVIPCPSGEATEPIPTEILQMDLTGAPPSEAPEAENGEDDDAGDTTSNNNLAASVSVSGGGSVAVSQALQVGGPTFSGDEDESLGTSSDDGTSFAAHVELNPGDSSTIFVGVSNQGANDIAYTLTLEGASGVTVSAAASGAITSLVQTGFYSWKFVLPGGAGGAGTGITLTVAVPDDAATGFYSIGTAKLKATNV